MVDWSRFRCIVQIWTAAVQPFQVRFSNKFSSFGLWPHPLTVSFFTKPSKKWLRYTLFESSSITGCRLIVYHHCSILPGWMVKSELLFLASNISHWFTSKPTSFNKWLPPGCLYQFSTWPRKQIKESANHHIHIKSTSKRNHGEFLQRKNLRSALSSEYPMGPERIRHSSHHLATQSSHSVDRAGWHAKMTSIEFWIPWRNAHSPHCD